MKRFFATTLAIFAVMASAMIAQPKLEIVGGDTHDWGKVSPKESPLKATIKIKNVGTELLKITDVHPGCGCTKTAELDKKELKPGEIATTELSLNVGQTTGDLTKSVTITSNDAANPTKILYLKANVVRPLQLSTQYLVFNDLKVGLQSEAKLVIKNTSPNDITISDFEATNGLSINFKKPVVIKSGSEAELIAHVTPKEKGYFNGMVKMKTTTPDIPTLDITAYGNVSEQTSPVYPGTKQ
ncbi:MAG: DUF1573 domain-containing protein [Candidatus Kapaibacterium sp.]